MMVKRILKALIRRSIWAVCWFLPIHQNKIVFSSFYGRGYGDNPKYIAEELLKQNQDYQLIWLVKDAEETKSLPEGIQPCQMGTVRAIFHVTTAEIWVDNCRKYFFYKKKKQYYIQTWHGFALKRIERDVVETLGKEYEKAARKDSRAIDIILSDSAFMTDIYKKAFWYDGRIVEWGSPRNDLMYCQEKRNESRKQVEEFYHIPQDDKIVLYAPTFRVDGSLEPYRIDIEGVKAACEKRFGSKFTAVIRLHPNVAEKSKELNFDWETNIDATRYPDMQMLLAAADVVISDYSSLMFDFALSGRPCFQFATDISEYKKDRNFYFRLDKLPFTVAETNEALLRDIEGFDANRYTRDLQAFFEGVGMNQEGTASEKCSQLIRSICFEKKRK